MMDKKIYMLRMPGLSLLWYKIVAKNEDEALKKIVKKINSKTVDYSDRSCWEIMECVTCKKKQKGV